MTPTAQMLATPESLTELLREIDTAAHCEGVHPDVLYRELGWSEADARAAVLELMVDADGNDRATVNVPSAEAQQLAIRLSAILESRG
jgi:hypothetical protein